MIESIRHIEIEKLGTVEQLQAVVKVLINALESMSSELSSVKAENLELKDTINRLKGEQGRPDIGKKGKQGKEDISSQGKEKGQGGDGEKQSATVIIEIDRTEPILYPSKDSLPSDAVLKYYRQVVIQDIVLKRDNVAYKLAVYYSPSQNKTYSGELPIEHQNGGYGNNLRSLLQILNKSCQVTEGSIEKLLKDLGIKISAGTISNILLEPLEWACEEQREIVRAGIEGSAYVYTDSTQNKEKGVAKKTHIIGAQYFVAYYTLASKSRLDIMRVLLGNPKEGLQIKYNEQGRHMLKVFKVSQEDQLTLSKLLQEGQMMSLMAFDTLIKEQAPSIFSKKNICLRIRESLALAYYHDQSDFPIADILLSDDAPEYQKIARLIHALCWVHDARHYNKLTPQFDHNKHLLEAFKSQYWAFYEQLIQYRGLDALKQHSQKPLLSAYFDLLFDKKTGYDKLDLLIERTKSNKQQLLAVLDNPALPLHNNAAELAVRQIVRKRDISLHTWSEKGTLVRDAFLTLIETANKLGVSAIQYIADRISKNYHFESLASLVAKAYA